MTDTLTIDPERLEKFILKGCLVDKSFLVMVSNVFVPEYFQNEQISKIFKKVSEHFEEFQNIPNETIITSSFTEDRDIISSELSDIRRIDFDVSANFDYLVKNTNIYLKDQAIKKALVESINDVENQAPLDNIRKRIEDALCKDLKIDLGLSYFRELGERLRRIFTATDTRIKTYYPTLDELLNGGFPPFTLSVLVAKIHGFKSNTMANFAARQVLNGHNVVLLTLEMSEDMFAQRFDAIYSRLDINRIYYGDQKRALQQRLLEIKRSLAVDAANLTRGVKNDLYIKQFPTGAASVKDFRIYLRELKIRDIKPDIIYVDYINLMKSLYKKTDDLYGSVKSIAEELRALSFEFEAPVVSVSQLNREGTFVSLGDVGYNYISESMGVPATADFMSIFGIDENAWIYESELHSKIVKNRLGGRVGDIWKSYYDSRSLKMYDESELDMWMSDGRETGEARAAAPVREQPVVRRRGRRPRQEDENGS
jgi:replicative DNA helicase